MYYLQYSVRPKATLSDQFYEELPNLRLFWKEIPGVTGYSNFEPVANSITKVYNGVGICVPEFMSVVEFDSLESLEAALDDPQVKAALKQLQVLADVAPIIRIFEGVYSWWT